MVMTRQTVKCPYCGAGWPGRKVSSRHVSSCQKSNTHVPSTLTTIPSDLTSSTAPDAFPLDRITNAIERRTATFIARIEEVFAERQRLQSDAQGHPNKWYREIRAASDQLIDIAGESDLPETAKTLILEKGDEWHRATIASRGDLTVEQYKRVVADPSTIVRMGLVHRPCLFVNEDWDGHFYDTYFDNDSFSPTPVTVVEQLLEDSDADIRKQAALHLKFPRVNK